MYRMKGKINMTLNELRNNPNYAFLNDQKFNNHTIQYLTLAGSIAYGTNNENSDIDIRGVFLENKRELLSLELRLEHFEDSKTDTVLYSLQNFIKLLTNCNPNVIELLGVKNEHIIYESSIFKLLKEHTSYFLSKKAFNTFTGYANAQLRRLQNALAHDTYDEKKKEEHILKTVLYELNRSENDFKQLNPNHEYHLYIDKLKNEIYCDLNLKHIGLRDLSVRINQLHATIRNFDKLNHRNRKKDDNHLYKHAMHLIRLYFTGIQILQDGIIQTYRPNHELKLLQDIRNGLVPFNDIFKLADELELKIKNIYEHSLLPEKPDYDRINDLLILIYENTFWKE